MDIKAPVGGSVWITCVSVGEVISCGAQILVMESMKLEIPVESPVGGKVTYLIGAGTLVEENELLATIEE